MPLSPVGLRVLPNGTSWSGQQDLNLRQPFDFIHARSDRTAKTRVSEYNWETLSADLSGYGCAVIEQLLSPEECRQTGRPADFRVLKA